MNNNIPLATNLREAQRLVNAFRQPNEGLCVQTFADGPPELYTSRKYQKRDGSEGIAYEWHTNGVRGPVSRTYIDVDLKKLAQFENANAARVGIFWTVNVLKPDSKIRKYGNFQRIAAVFIDLDGQPLPDSFPIQPTAIVESSAERFHVYWACHGVALEEFETFQKTLAHIYGADPVVCDIPRVMRLAGFFHGKTEQLFRTRILELNETAQYQRDDLLMAWPQISDALRLAQLEKEEQRVKERVRQRPRSQQNRPIDQNNQLQKFVETALWNETTNVFKSIKGHRNETLNKAAFALGQLIGAGVLDEIQVHRELEYAAESVGLSKSEAIITIQSGITAGKNKPRNLMHVGQLTTGSMNSISSQDTPVNANSIVESPSEQLEPLRQIEQINIENIPAPNGENGNYSDEQVLDFVGLRDWGLLGVETDTAHAERLHRMIGTKLAYVPQLHGWLHWKEEHGHGKWVQNEGGKDGAGVLEARRLVREIGKYMIPEKERVLNLYLALQKEATQREAKDGKNSEHTLSAKNKAQRMKKVYFFVCKTAKQLENKSKQKDVLETAAPYFLKNIELFEPKEWLVGFCNGTWDKGEFRPAKYDDYLLATSRTSYNKNIDCSEWLNVLERITKGDKELQRTLQEIAGYTMSGFSALRLIFWLYGPAGTGKSTFAELLSTVLDSMAVTLDTKHLSSSGERERLGAAIWGKRLVMCAEAGNARIDAELLKTLSGGDRITVRRLYTEAFTAKPRHTLMMVANDVPRVEAYDEALKTRVLAVPFDHRLDEGTKLLQGKRLESERMNPDSELVRGFCVWAVEGMNRVFETGDVYCASVCQQATEGFWRDVDQLTDFWLEQDTEELRQGVGVTEFRGRYETWCESNGTRALGRNKWNKACQSVGLDYCNAGKRKVWILQMPLKYPC